MRHSAIDRYLRRLLPPGDFRRYGTIKIQSDADGDSIFIDDKPRGETPAKPFQVPAPGRYGVRVSRKGHNDFIMASVGEELGFVGFALILILFGLIVWRGARAALGSRESVAGNRLYAADGVVRLD